MKKTSILNVNFNNITQNNFFTSLIDDSLSHKNRFIVTANPEIVLHARKDINYLKILEKADYIVADGIGIILGANILKKPLPERITGFDTMIFLLDWGNKNHKSVYLIGAKKEVIETTVKKIRSNYPNLKVVGYHDGYFKNDTTISLEISRTKPDFVFVALGFPKQEEFIAKHRYISSSIWMGVGGSFDVFSGFLKRAPLFWQRHNIEWLYRLLKQPKRFKRMLALPKYILLIYQEKYRKRGSKK